MKGNVLPPQADGSIPIELITDRQGCEGCATRGFCKLPDAERLCVPPSLLPEGTRAGDVVSVDLPAGFRVWLAFSTFILPLLLLVGGAFVGSRHGEAWSLILGCTGLGLGLGLTIFLHRRARFVARIRITRC